MRSGFAAKLRGRGNRGNLEGIPVLLGLHPPRPEVGIADTVAEVAIVNMLLCCGCVCVCVAIARLRQCFRAEERDAAAEERAAAAAATVDDDGNADEERRALIANIEAELEMGCRRELQPVGGMKQRTSSRATKMCVSRRSRAVLQP